MSKREDMGRRMRFLRVVASGLAAIAALAASGIQEPQPAHASQVAGLPKLKGINQITSSGTSRTTVRLERAARVSAKGGRATALIGSDDDKQFHSRNPDISISGGGRIAGIALVETGTKEVFDRKMLLAVNLSFCEGPACKTKEGPYLYLGGFTDAQDDHFILPAGNYLLYTITDGTPVTARLRLHGLKGKARIEPSSAPGDVSVSTPEDSFSESTTRAGHSYGESYELRGDEGLLLTAFRLRGDLWLNGRYGLCMYNDEPTTPRPLAYSYPCTEGFGVYIGDGFIRPSPYQNLFHTAIHVIRDGGGPLALGGGYFAAADVKRFDFVQLHMDLPPEEVATRAAPDQQLCDSAKAGADPASGDCLRLPPIRRRSAHHGISTHLPSRPPKTEAAGRRRKLPGRSLPYR